MNKNKNIREEFKYQRMENGRGKGVTELSAEDRGEWRIHPS